LLTPPPPDASPVPRRGAGATAPGGGARRRRLFRLRALAAGALRLLLLLLLLGLLPLAVRADGIELTTFEVQRSEEGVLLTFVAAFELPKSVEDALLKGVPLHFEAEADLLQDRWYWRDKRVAHASRGWRLTYQPLTRRFRVGFGGLNQTYDTLAEALGSLRRSALWKIAEPGQLDDGSRHYVEFVFRLDTAQLPRPMQIGIGGQPDWSLSVERRQRFN